MALDAAPHSIEALDLLVQFTPAEDRPELCARYDAFLLAVPFHPQAPRVREALIDLLLEYGHYDLAAHHVGAVSKESWTPPASDEIAAACDIREPEPELALEQEEIEPLDEFDLDPFEVVYEVADYELIDAADAAE